MSIMMKHLNLSRQCRYLKRKNNKNIIYLNHENTRHYGSVREMPWEEVIIYCHILDCNSIFSWLVINNSVNQKEWEPTCISTKNRST